MVDLDAEVMRVSRLHLESYSNCTGFGTPSCFDDPRAEVYAENFILWFEKHLGDDICERQEEKKDQLFDVIILDLLDAEELPQGVAWAEYLFSDLFFERLSCSLTKFGVLVTNFGEAPEAPFGGLPPNKLTKVDLDRSVMFAKKITQIQSMSRRFFHSRVYETYIPSYRALWAFAIGILPKRTEELDSSLAGGVFDGHTNGGVNDFDGKPARVNLKVRRELKEGARFLFYDGAVQHGFQQSQAGWKDIYCLNSENTRICELESLFTKDYEDELFEYRLDDTGAGTSGVAAKKDIPRGTVSGMWDAATAMDLPGNDYYMLQNMAKGINTTFHYLDHFVERYG
jgi:hypothetical protein